MFLHRSLAAPLGLLIAACPTATAMNNLFVVDVLGGPGTDFTNLQVAADTVPNGSVILVRTGQPTNLTLGDKSLTLIVEALSSPVQIGVLEVESLGADKTLTLRGFEFTGNGIGDKLIGIEDCAGRIRFEECEANAYANPVGRPALQLSNCADAWFIDCDLQGSDGTSANPFFPAYIGTPAAILERSTAVFVDSSLAGGDGAPGEPSVGSHFGVDAASALWLFDSTVWLSGTQVTGGNGGAGANSSCGLHGESGDGIRLSGTAFDGSLGGPIGFPSRVVGTGTTVLGGVSDTTVCNPTPTLGQPLDEDVPGLHTVDLAAGPSRSLSGDSPAFGGTAVQISAAGAPLDQFLLAFGTPLQALAVAGQRLPLALGNVGLVVDLGLTAADGSLQFTQPLGPLPPGFGALTLHFQGVAIPAGSLAIELVPAGTLTLVE